MGVRVSKFGGSSLADAGQIGKALEIVRADDRRRYVVPSAPGKCHREDNKITDLLLRCHRQASQGESIDDSFAAVSNRFIKIEADLGLNIGMAGLLEEIRKQLLEEVSASRGPAYIASRGEHLNGRLVAAALDIPFIDPIDQILFNDLGQLQREATYERLGSTLKKHQRAVIPGFYGGGPDGRVMVFSRGGSDVTGSIVARSVQAELYENWTDVSGLLMADPRIVKNPRRIESLTYRELRELSYMGATVLHDEAVFPVREAAIPVEVRNTNAPDEPGTLIVPTENAGEVTTPVTGIAGRRDFTIIAVEKALMNSEVGFGRKLLSVIEEQGICFEHMPSGIDTMSIVLRDDLVSGKIVQIVDGIRQAVNPDNIEVFPDIALIATVGRGMAKQTGTAARLMNALAQANVNIRMIDQGSSELNIIVGIEAEDFEVALNAIYHAFVPKAAADQAG
ncbi:aspartate kinase [Mucisphaera sp.]|uniref:aspartate kinase n=1 Tax=Mucisphaera sp. TaxID=2913024 RepID=UPI003D0B0BEF